MFLPRVKKVKTPFSGLYKTSSTPLLYLYPSFKIRSGEEKLARRHQKNPCLCLPNSVAVSLPKLRIHDTSEISCALWNFCEVIFLCRYQICSKLYTFMYGMLCAIQFLFPHMNSRGGLRIPIFFSFQFMPPTIFAEKNVCRILSDVSGYGHVFLDRIREWNWFTLVYDNLEYEAYYCPELVKIFYSSIDQTILISLLISLLCIWQLGTSLSPLIW